MRRFLLTVGLIALPLTLSGCAPLLVGAAGAVVADQVAEDQKGGDGLF